MRRSELTQRMREDHARIRERVRVMERLAQQVRDGERHHLGPLRIEGQALHEILATHMHWETVHFAPLLSIAKARQLECDHREQREVLEHTLAALRDQSRPAIVLARTMLDLAHLIREDTNEEEALLADPSVASNIKFASAEAETTKMGE